MKVCIVPEFPLNLMSGGLQVQACELAESLNNISEIQASLFNWSDQSEPAELYHFVSIQASLFPMAELLRQRNIPYIMTVLVGCPPKAVIAWASFRRGLAEKVFSGSKMRKRVYDSASKIIVILEPEIEAVSKIYNVPKRRIEVVPNGISSRFYKSSPDLWRQTFGEQDA